MVNDISEYPWYQSAQDPDRVTSYGEHTGDGAKYGITILNCARRTRLGGGLRDRIINLDSLSLYHNQGSAVYFYVYTIPSSRYDDLITLIESDVTMQNENARYYAEWGGELLYQASVPSASPHDVELFTPKKCGGIIFTFNNVLLSNGKKSSIYAAGQLVYPDRKRTSFF
jgi:hypothetical protein